LPSVILPSSKAKLPYVILAGGGGFYNCTEIKDCLCFLRWICDGNDDSAMKRAFRTPGRRLDDKAVAPFTSYCSKVDSHYRVSAPGTPRPSKLDIMLAMTGEESTSLMPGNPRVCGLIPTSTIKSILSFAKQMNNLTNEAMTSTVDSLLFFSSRILTYCPILSPFPNRTLSLLNDSKTCGNYDERPINIQMKGWLYRCDPLENRVAKVK